MTIEWWVWANYLNSCKRNFFHFHLIPDMEMIENPCLLPMGKISLLVPTLTRTKFSHFSFSILSDKFVHTFSPPSMLKKTNIYYVLRHI